MQTLELRTPRVISKYKVRSTKEYRMSEDSEKTARLKSAAERALAEAEERRKAAQPLDLPTELGGRDGPEPIRYGDWENKGIATDF